MKYVQTWPLIAPGIVVGAVSLCSPCSRLWQPYITLPEGGCPSSRAYALDWLLQNSWSRSFTSPLPPFYVGPMCLHFHSGPATASPTTWGTPHWPSLPPSYLSVSETPFPGVELMGTASVPHTLSGIHIWVFPSLGLLGNHLYQPQIIDQDQTEHFSKYPRESFCQPHKIEMSAV